ncbi:MAG: flagellar hook-basal body complex protein FliE [Puniceicoccaceae bacterium 5H]|nr:MAG: flagellar hook-basal body complex protein FliE [Puniceicoccaceae bacterium 5H]
MAGISSLGSLNPALLTRLDPQRAMDQARQLQNQVGGAQKLQADINQQIGQFGNGQEWMDKLAAASQRPVEGPGAVQQAPDAVARTQFTGVPGVSTEGIGNLATDFIREVDAKQDVAATEVRELMTGESTNLHQAMISMRESGLAFTMMVEVRNKLMESFQELMRMQV